MKSRALVCDLDGTLFTDFSTPIVEGVQALLSVHHSIVVHYVTARLEYGRAATLAALDACQLRYRANLHLCPEHLSSLAHKTRVMMRLARNFEIRVSVGDSAEDEDASRTAGIPFLSVYDRVNWSRLSEFL